MQPDSNYAELAGREIHWLDWRPAQPEGAPVVIAWHGLAGTGRDMDALARHLCAGGCRVICPDSLGCGLSQWSLKPDEEYQLAFHAHLAARLCDLLGLARMHWVGTSAGAALGTVCASGLVEPGMKARIASLVLDDNAPELAAAAVARLRACIGNVPAFETVRELEAFFLNAFFGLAPSLDGGSSEWPGEGRNAMQWRRLAETSIRRLPDGRVTLHCDPAIVRQFSVHPNDHLIWHHYYCVEAPVLCLRSARSEWVLPETIRLMRSRGPGARDLLQVIELPEGGSMPPLHAPAQLDAVATFIAAKA